MASADFFRARRAPRDDILIRRVRPGDVETLAACMRHDDIEEIRAAGGREPLEALLASVEVSRLSGVMVLGGELACIYGVAPISPTTGVAWCLTGEPVTRHRVAFLRACRVVLPVLLEDSPTLINMVDARHRGATRWLERLGFTVEAPVPYGPLDLPFHPIRLKAPHV